MKETKVIEVGHIITSEKIGGAEKALRVDSIREIDGENRYYVTAEGVQGTHVVLESEVVDHVTAEEYAELVLNQKPDSSEDSEEESEVGNETQPTSEVGNESLEPTTPSATTQETVDSSSSAQQTSADSSPVPANTTTATEPAAPAQQQKNQQQQGKNNNNKRRV